MMLNFFRKLSLVALISIMAYILIGCPKKPEPIVPVSPPPPPPVKPYTPPPPPVKPPPAKVTPTTIEPTKLPPTPTEPESEPEPEPEPVEKLDTIYFDYDKSNIRSDAEETLTHNASWLKKGDNESVKILIEGHCDKRGTDEYNIALGDRRAKSSKKFLVNMGIESSRIDTISYGESRPAKDGDDESAWKWNRRAEFIVK